MLGPLVGWCVCVCQKWSLFHAALGPLGPGVIRNGRFFKGFCYAVPFGLEGASLKWSLFKSLSYVRPAQEGVSEVAFSFAFAMLCLLSRGGFSEMVAFS